MSKYPVVIGRFEYIDVIDKCSGVPAKIDTGAYHSSIHADHIEEFTKNGKPTLRFTLLGHPVHKESATVETTRFTVTTVRSSNGHQVERYKIFLKIRLGYKVFSTPFTLSGRSKNVFPVLIGREALRKRYLVDAAKAGIERINLLKAARQEAMQEEEMEGVNR